MSQNIYFCSQIHGEDFVHATEDARGVPNALPRDNTEPRGPR